MKTKICRASIADLWASLNRPQLPSFFPRGPQRLRTEDVDDRKVERVLDLAAFCCLQNTAFRFGPVALTATMTTNILNPGTTTGGVACTGSPYGNLYLILRNIRVVNKHASIAATFNLYIGATGGNVAGTELALTIPVPVGGEYNISPPGGIRLDVADFLVGGSNTATALTIEGHGEIGISK